jgi:hypothetical protein
MGRDGFVCSSSRVALSATYLASQHSKGTAVRHTAILDIVHQAAPLIPQKLEFPFVPFQLRLSHGRHEDADRVSPTHRVPRVFQMTHKLVVVTALHCVHALLVDRLDALVDRPIWWDSRARAQVRG